VGITHPTSGRIYQEMKEMKENKDNFLIRSFHIKHPEIISDSDFDIFKNNCNNWIKNIQLVMNELKSEQGLELSIYSFHEPTLSKDKNIVTFSFGGIVSYLKMKFFEDAFPADLLKDFSIIFKFDLILGYENPLISNQIIWINLYTEREQESIKRYSQITEDDRLINVDLEYSINNNRQELGVDSISDWAICPFCKIKFKITNLNSFNHGRHLTCGQKLKINVSC
jgi:hypothetical protein